MVYLCAAVGGGFGRGGGGGAGGAQESWNWSSNATVTIRCYTTCQEVTLTLNDQPLGSKQLADAVQGTLTWQVPFQPGVLKAVGHSNGKPDCEFVLKTAGPAGAVALLPEVTKLRANGKDVSCIEFRVVDDQGVRVPNAAQELTFTVEGPGKLIDLDNGDLNTPESGKDGKRHVLRGHGLAIVQATREPGRIRLTAKAEGLKDATVEIDAQ